MLTSAPKHFLVKHDSIKHRFRANMFAMSVFILVVNFKHVFTPGINSHKIFIFTHEPKQIELEVAVT